MAPKIHVATSQVLLIQPTLGSRLYHRRCDLDVSVMVVFLTLIT